MSMGVDAYRARVTGGGSIREGAVVSPCSRYRSAEQVRDFPADVRVLLEVAQIRPNGEPGGTDAGPGDDSRAINVGNVQICLNIPIFRLVLHGYHVPR
jgi:hypothetical protein